MGKTTVGVRILEYGATLTAEAASDKKNNNIGNINNVAYYLIPVTIDSNVTVNNLVKGFVNVGF